MPTPAKTHRRVRFIAGGPDDDEAVDDTPQFARHPCAANGCPMPGTMFPSGSYKGICAWHYRTNASDWPRITQALRDWNCVSYEVNEARRVLTDQDMCTDVRAQNDAFRAAWQRLQPALVAGGWSEDELKPAAGEGYGGWAKRLEAFVGGQVLQCIAHRARRQAA